ncbi:hypothetical protein LHJ74_03880 [Streptomyces sp. N2-109]|uniref:Uncharacterized protein n=1 Tax=Streptomyces gossypii TaxID=2883101 RepID=A0ABT2JNJ5_9ACTN|nr:hypothetical protein [Streptomyces gossypii]MCT2589084.1 hypothetical protein [Streptomyces gossypii]
MSAPPPPSSGGYGPPHPEPPPGAPAVPPPGSYAQSPYAQDPYPAGRAGRAPAGGSGRVAALAVSVGVLALTMVAWIVWQAYDGDPGRDQTGSAAAPETVYVLTLPETLLDQEYSLARDLSESVAQSIPQDTEFGRQLESTAGVYAASSGADEFVYQGLTSRLTDPAYPRYGILDNMGDDPGIEIAVPRQTFTSGDRGDIVCEVQVKISRGKTETLPSCSWTDRHTQGIVMDSSPATTTADPAAVDLAALAVKVALIRDEVRVPAA